MKSSHLANIARIGAFPSIVLFAVAWNRPAESAVISGNFVSTSGAAGTIGAANTAGFVPVANWNDMPAAPQVNYPLLDDQGSPTGATLNAALSNGGGDVHTFPNPADNRIFRGNEFVQGFATGDLIFANVPYSEFDLYIYYDGAAGIADQTQMFTIVSLALSQTVFEDAQSVDSAFILGTPATHGNYLVFSGLTLPNFTLRMQGISGQYGYLNGFQIVDVPEVPEPSTLALLGLGVVGLAFKARRRRRAAA
jgi:hypothetical protein